jgi:hypothetical protein
MRRVFKFVTPVTAALILTACGNGSATKEGHEGHADTSNAGTTSVSTATSLKDGKLNAVYQHYIHLTTALVNSDSAEAKVAANAIEAGARQMEGGAVIAAQASKITNASDIEVQRAAYEVLSNNMIELVKKSGLSSGELYVDYCPMAFDDKGAAWLSNNKEIRNPYFGDKMLKCGEIKETIK